jgi:hypothetical protein
MFADTLMQLERAHLMRVLVWGVASVLAGTAMLAGLTATRRQSRLLEKFGLVTAASGAIELCVGLVSWRGLGMRDLAAATRLDRLLWLATGLDVGILAVGLTLAIASWSIGRRLGPVGAALGLVVQGAALFALHGRFLLRLEGMF